MLSTNFTEDKRIVPEELAQECVRLAEDKKAEDIVVLDLRGISSFTDFFVICSATSEPHLKAISSGIRENLHKLHGLSPLASDGVPASQWVVIDYSDVLVHIFQAEKREFYALENLWSDAPRFPIVSSFARSNLTPSDNPE